MRDDTDWPAFRGDVLAAVLLALLLATVWTLRDWHNLSALRLPDTDDVMRLQQIRDWLAGQRFADLSQHRLGAEPGLAMHWSRVADLAPAGIISALTPWIGRHGAEIAAVIAWPTLLLATALVLTAQIARILGGAQIARTALIVAAIAYPASTIFVPGRIDHHGLQIVLLLVIVYAVTGPIGMKRGFIAGAAAALSITIGLETVPLIAVAGGVLVAGWIGFSDIRRGSDDALMGFGIALVAGLLVANIALRTDQWRYPGCDGFTAMSWRAMQFAAFAPVVLAIAGRSSRRRDVRSAMAVLVGAGVVFSVWRMAPMCLSPYGNIDPMLTRLWLNNVGEAQGLFAARPEVAMGYAGLMVAGIVANLWWWLNKREAALAALLAFQLGAFALTCLQMRGAYAGAILAAPALAAVITAARARGTGWLAAAWLGSAGMLYPLAANAFAPVETGTPGVASTAVLAGQGACTSPEALARLAPLKGRLMAPLDLGAFALAESRLSVVGAPYHRNNHGNAAVYRFFLGSPENAQKIARDWRVNYVAVCSDSFSELGAPTGLLGQLRAGRAPVWMRPIDGPNDGLTLFAVQPRLLAEPPAL